jgi:hypothetical protein
MKTPLTNISDRLPYEAEGVFGKCGYCHRALASVAFIYRNAKPTCGSAWCLQHALLESNRQLAA